MNDDVDVNAIDARQHTLKLVSTICRYFLAVVAVVVGATTYRCNPDTPGETAAKYQCAADHGKATECERWTQ